MFENENLETVLKEIDLDGDGNIDFDEFVTASADHRKLLSSQNISFVF